MAISPRSDSFEVTDYLAVLRRRWWIVFGLACLGTLAAAAYVAVTPKSYTATTGVYVTANAANVNNVAGSRTATGPTVNMDNEAQVVKSITVAAKAAGNLHSRRSADQLSGQVSVTVPANTSLLNISCTAPSATGSAACAQAFAKAYLAVRQGNALDKIANNRTQLEARAKPLQAQAIKLKNKVKSLPANSTELATTKAELQDTISKLAVLRKDLSALSASVNTSAGNIITPALVPRTPSNPRPLLYVPSGLLVGLLLGLALAFAVDRRDDRIHSAADVERFLDVPVLFSLPLKRLSLQTSIVSPRSRTGRAFTDLAQAVAAGLGDGNHVIMVAGTSAGEGGSVIAANLAATLARTRSDVILVCADLRGSVTPRLLGVGDGRGLAEVLAGNATISEVARRPAEVARLRVITPGVDTSAALNHLQHDATRRIVAELQRDARYVVIEAQATGDGADTFSLAEFADASLVVIEVSSTRLSEASDSIRRLDRMRTAVLGATVLPPIRGKSRSAARAAKSKPKLEPRFAQSAARPGQAKPRTLPGDPRPRVLPGQGQSQRTGTSAAVARGAGETWPLPRVPVGSPPEGKAPRPVPDDPADKGAGSS
jgi:capsular polysaccharide biosynthesis protein/MinD-like ATPase involved in chromosome partitioning or flagellar assembly